MQDARRQSSVVITGAGSGIGREIALAFAAAGWQVHICGRREAPLAETAHFAANALAASTTPTLAVTYSTCDITDEDQVRELFVQARSTFGAAPDAVVLNAGLPGQPAEFGAVDLDDFRATISTNVEGSFLVARQAFREMKARFSAEGIGGRILVNCSIAAETPRAHTASYAASKAALAGLTHVLALDGRPYRIHATRIDIGNASTDLLGSFTTAEPQFSAVTAAEAFVYAASIPEVAVVDQLTITAAGMPFLGRG